MSAWSTVFLGNLVNAHIFKITRILWNPNFVNFDVFLGVVAGNYLLLKKGHCVNRKSEADVSVKLLCFETSGTK
jgi:hypothetical protein